MVIDIARQQPFSWVISYHFSCDAGCWEKTNCVCMMVLGREDLAMEMNRMHVHLFEARPFKMGAL